MMAKQNVAWPYDEILFGNRPPQICHSGVKDYFELKAPEKQQMQDRHSDLLVFILHTGARNFHVKEALPIPGERTYSLTQRHS